MLLSSHAQRPGFLQPVHCARGTGIDRAIMHNLIGKRSTFSIQPPAVFPDAQAMQAIPSTVHTSSPAGTNTFHSGRLVAGPEQPWLPGATCCPPGGYTTATSSWPSYITPSLSSGGPGRPANAATPCGSELSAFPQPQITARQRWEARKRCENIGECQLQGKRFWTYCGKEWLAF